MKSRKSDLLNDVAVTLLEFRGLIFLLATRLIKNKKLLNKLSHLISKMYANEVIKICERKNVNVIFSFDNYSFDLFERIKDKKIIKVLDMSSIPLKNIKEIYKSKINDMNLDEDEKESLIELNSSYDEEMVERSNLEIKYADYFLVASNYTKNQLLKLNIKDDKIFTIPYGVETDIFKPNNIKRDFTVLFVGRMNAAKGFYKLLETAISMNDYNIKFVFVGNLPRRINIDNNYKNIEIISNVPKNKMPEIFGLADVLVAPTLFDGFGLSVLEAMSSGLAIITNGNCGASEIVSSSDCGFVLDDITTKTLQHSINVLYKDRVKLKSCKINARKEAEKYNWKRYEDEIKKALKIIKDRNSNEL